MGKISSLNVTREPCIPMLNGSIASDTKKCTLRYTLAELKHHITHIIGPTQYIDNRQNRITYNPQVNEDDVYFMMKEVYVKN